MLTLFRYNWMVRDEWFDLCSKLSQEELVKERVGGLKTILGTLLHIVAVEESWIADLKGVPESELDFADFQTIVAIKEFSDSSKVETERMVCEWNQRNDSDVILCPAGNGEKEGFAFGEILRHLIAHEIHHVGQLSVWAREMGIQPPSANLIRRGLFFGNKTV